MTAFEDRVRGRVTALTAKVGKSITYRRISVSSGPVPLQNPPTTPNAITVQSGELTGATSLQVGGAGFRGRVVAGDTFTVAGNAQVYTITADANIDRANGTVTLVFSPGLSADASISDAVAFTWSGDTTVVARISSYTNMYQGGSLMEAPSTVAVIPGEALSAAPKVGDQLIIDTETLTIFSVPTDFVQENPGLWRVQAR